LFVCVGAFDDDDAYDDDDDDDYGDDDDLCKFVSIQSIKVATIAAVQNTSNHDRLQIPHPILETVVGLEDLDQTGLDTNHTEARPFRSWGEWFNHKAS
jgi:hypothetical protein